MPWLLSSTGQDCIESTERPFPRLRGPVTLTQVGWVDGHVYIQYIYIYIIHIYMKYICMYNTYMYTYI